MPGDRRHLVCLTFDFDALSAWIFRGATTPTVLSRGEFGPRVGIPRLLDLCRRLEVRATFFTPGHTRGIVPARIKELARLKIAALNQCDT